MSRFKVVSLVAGGIIVAILAVFSLLAISGGLNATSMFFQRKIFEQSYQRSEGLNQRLATLEASLAEVETLLNSDIDNATRKNLEIQRSALNARIHAAERGMK